VDGRFHSGRLLLQFKGISDRNAAEALRGTMLVAEIDPEERPEDPEEYYDHQLIGLAVVLADGTLVGELAEIAHLPSQELLTVKRPDGSEVLVPFVTEIVPEIDMQNRRIVITPPPGLINTDEAEVASAREDADAPDAEASDAEASE
jgi:16S rRNA processing protein RimM